MRRIALPCLLASASLAAACTTAPDDAAPETVSADATHDPRTVAIVNGVEITEDDLIVASHPRPGQPVALSPGRRRNLLELTIRRELEAQEAARLELEPTAEEQAQLAALEATAREHRRTALSQALERNRRSQVEVSEADARSYFEEHASRLRNEVHVWQILLRDRARIDAAHASLEGGARFEEVARSNLPGIPEGQTPWDLGFLRWNQVPEPWRTPLAALQPGQSTGVIAGPRNRYWLVHLVERRENPAITFESERATIEEILRTERLQARESETTRRLRADAEIVYVESEAAEPAEPTEPE